MPICVVHTCNKRATWGTRLQMPAYCAEHAKKRNKRIEKISPDFPKANPDYLWYVIGAICVECGGEIGKSYLAYQRPHKASYGYPGKKAVACARHKKEGMFGYWRTDKHVVVLQEDSKTPCQNKSPERGIVGVSAPPAELAEASTPPAELPRSGQAEGELPRCGRAEGELAEGSTPSAELGEGSIASRLAKGLITRRAKCSTHPADPKTIPMDESYADDEFLPLARMREKIENLAKTRGSRLQKSIPVNKASIVAKEYDSDADNPPPRKIAKTEKYRATPEKIRKTIESAAKLCDAFKSVAGSYRTAAIALQANAQEPIVASVREAAEPTANTLPHIVAEPSTANTPPAESREEISTDSRKSSIFSPKSTLSAVLSVIPILEKHIAWCVEDKFETKDTSTRGSDVTACFNLQQNIIVVKFQSAQNSSELERIKTAANLPYAFEKKHITAIFCNIFGDYQTLDTGSGKMNPYNRVDILIDLLQSIIAVPVIFDDPFKIFTVCIGYDRCRSCISRQMITFNKEEKRAIVIPL